MKFIMVRTYGSGFIYEALNGGVELADGRKFRLELEEQGTHRVVPVHLIERSDAAALEVPDDEIILL